MSVNLKFLPFIGLVVLLWRGTEVTAGRNVGVTIPNFEAVAQDGRTWKLGELLGPNGALLVAFPSVASSPLSRAQLLELEQNVKQFDRLGLKITGLSTDQPAMLKRFAESSGIHFPLLSDPRSTIIRRIGSLDTGVSPHGTSPGTAYSGTYILDRNRTLVGKYCEVDPRYRYSVGNILVQQFGLTADPRQTRIEGKQLAAVASASNSIIYPGERAALMLDIELKPNMHVYAPGVQEYSAIEWTMNDSKLITMYAPVYPKAELLVLPPINLRVPVYSGHIRIMREFTASADWHPPGGVDRPDTLVLEGKLGYQACDDHMCYFPQYIDLKWTFPVM